jgi:hypothetical protein
MCMSEVAATCRFPAVEVDKGFACIKERLHMVCHLEKKLCRIIL